MDDEERELSPKQAVAPSRRGKRGVTIYVDPALHRRLKLHSVEAGVSMQTLVEAAIRNLLDAHGAPAAPQPAKKAD